MATSRVLCSSPSGDRIALKGLNHWARVFDAQTGKPLTSELPHYYLLTGAASFKTATNS